MLAGIVWLAAGVLWFVGAVILQKTNQPTLAIVYSGIGTLDLVLALAAFTS